MRRFSKSGVINSNSLIFIQGKGMKIYIFIVILILPSRILLAYSGNGSGTTEDPYEITNVDQLQEMRDDLNSYYELENDIDASDTKYWNDGKGFLPIGDSTMGFSGWLDGKNFEISNLYINRPEQNLIGLFGKINSEENPTKNKATILNISVINADISGNNYTGIICGINSGIIINSISDGVVTGADGIGGFCGKNTGYIQNCSSSGKVFSDCYLQGLGIGGFCGNNEYRSKDQVLRNKIINCSSSATVEGRYFVGGFCGRNGAVSLDRKSDIIRCNSSGNVIGDSLCIGGFCGLNYANINYCHTSGNVTNKGTPSCCFGGFCGINKSFINNSYSSGDVLPSIGMIEDVGGFCGLNSNGYILDCYCIGNVLSTGYYNNKNVGGFCGRNRVADELARIENSYCIGKISGTENVGGFCGNQERVYFGTVEIVNCFWNIDSTGTLSSYGGTGKRTGEMKDIATFLQWDLTNNWEINPNKNNGFPTLIEFFGFSGVGSGTETDPYQITNLKQLQEMKNDLNANYKIMNDIDAIDSEKWFSGRGFKPIGSDANNPFSGNLNGQGYSISNLYINRPFNKNVGLFGCLGNEKNCLIRT